MRDLVSAFRNGGLAVLALIAGGCASILGVEEASCDPNFDDACRGGTNNTTGEDSNDDSSVDGGGQSSGPLTKEQACAQYCEDVTRQCTGDELRQYLNEDTCNTVCLGMLPLADGDAGVLDDTLECRATIAANDGFFTDDALGACETAGPMGVDCGDECEKYCDYMQRFCPEDFAENFADDCVAKCELVPRKDAYVFTTIYENSLECRFLHIQLSIEVSSKRLDHCSHAAGEALCVD